MWFRAICVLIFLFVSTLSVEAQNRYASIIVDADTLDVLHARQIDETRYPASLTKVMTLHIVFDALDAGTLRLDEKLTVSRNAARTPPVELGLRTGQKITVEELIQSVAVRSHNDSAVVLAERLGGSEAGFAELMNAKAAQLGMQRTVFRTPNGLPHPDQVTTARDMAKLAHSILTTHRARYHYFGQKYFRGQKNTNALLHDMVEVDGLKTGYTRASGFNLMVSATRNGRRQIAVVLGGASGESRNQHMRDLIERGFDVMGVIPKASTQVAVSTRNQGLVLRGSHSVLQTGSWAVALRNLPSEGDVKQTVSELANNSPATYSSGFVKGKPVYHAKISGLTAQKAKSICEATQSRCWLIAPQ